MKYIHRILGVVTSLAMLVIVLISSFELAAYSDFGWYEKEYEKYMVLEELEMEMPDVMDVTEEMMKYLRGNRENLVVDTVVNGREREFFNAREKAHMVDVQNLFLGGIKLRQGAVLTVLVIMVVFVVTKAPWKDILPKSFLAATGLVMGITIFLGVLFMSDFYKYFTLFHEIFFDNDLWLLDPDTDLMIRMLPEGFFLDMVMRIGVIFLGILLCLLMICIVAIIRQKIRTTNKIF